jgi:replicative DNA helicase
MLAHVSLKGQADTMRTDQVLEELYKSARELAVRLDIPVIVTVQMSADAEGVAYPSMSMLKDSKTGVQGATDVIITIGSDANSGTNLRFIGQTKNKLIKPGSKLLAQFTADFNHQTGIFRDA